MVRISLNILFVLLCLSSVCWATRYSDAKLKAEFGPNLTSAPFFLRYSFEQKYGEDWQASSYADRAAFLREYEIDSEAEARSARAEARAEARQARDEQRAKRQAQRNERLKQRQELAEEKAEAKAEHDRQKAFDKTIADQKKELQNMRQQFDQQKE